MHQSMLNCSKHSNAEMKFRTFPSNIRLNNAQFARFALLCWYMVGLDYSRFLFHFDLIFLFVFVLTFFDMNNKNDRFLCVRLSWMTMRDAHCIIRSGECRSLQPIKCYNFWSHDFVFIYSVSLRPHIGDRKTRMRDLMIIICFFDGIPTETDLFFLWIRNLMGERALCVCVYLWCRLETITSNSRFKTSESAVRMFVAALFAL